MFYFAKTKIERETIANNRFQLKFQDYYFRQCVGLMHCLRWGKYVFDVRPLREYLGLGPEPEEYYLNTDYITFQKRTIEIAYAVGDRSFFLLNRQVNKFILEKSDELKKENKANGVDVDLPL